VSGVLPVSAFADAAADSDLSSTAGTSHVKDSKRSHHDNRDADEIKQHRKSESGKGHHKNSDIGKGMEGTGLDAATLDLVNHGQWQAVETRLATRNSPVGSRDSAWLAFTYMYMGRCDELHALATQARAIYDAREAVHLPASPSAGAKASNSAATTSITATPANPVTLAKPSTMTSPSTSTTSTSTTSTSTTSTSTTSNTSTSSSSKPSSPTTTSTSTTDSQPGVGKSPTNEAETYALLVQVYDEVCATRFADAAAELDNVPAWFRYDSLTNFTLAALAGKQGRTANAIEYMERAVGAAPDFAWGYRTVGKLEQKRMNSVKAENFYVSALAIAPDLSEVVDALVDIRLKNNNFDGAVDVAKAAIDQAPKDSSNYYRLAQIYIQQWRLREALTELKTAIDLDTIAAERQSSAIKMT
jgi:tetratricopeptide (TPR) repeat protein